MLAGRPRCTIGSDQPVTDMALPVIINQTQSVLLRCIDKGEGLRNLLNPALIINGIQQQVG